MGDHISRAELSAGERSLRSRIAQLASGGRFLHGSLSERITKCGKPTCHCADGAGHRSLYLVQSQAGKVRQICVPKAWQDPVREAVGVYQEIRRLLDEISALERNSFQSRER